MRFLILFLLPLTIFAKDYNNVEYIKNYDGDTITVNLPCDDELYCKNMKVRVNNVDTPEIRGKCYYEKKIAIKAKIFVAMFLEHNIILKNCKRGKYFRIVCDVFSDKGNLSSELIKLNLGVPYGGKTKKTWCK